MTKARDQICPVCQQADRGCVVKGQGGVFSRFQCDRCKDFVVSINAAPRLKANTDRAWQFAAISSKLPTDKLLLITVPDPKHDGKGSDDALCTSEELTTTWACD